MNDELLLTDEEYKKLAEKRCFHELLDIALDGKGTFYLDIGDDYVSFEFTRKK